MIIKTYGIYDTVAKTLRSTFVADNDEVAIRSCYIAAKEPKADRATLKDCVVKFLYGVNSEDGTVCDVTQRDIIAFAAVIEEVGEVNVNAESIADVKEMFEKVKQSYDSVGKNVADFNTVSSSLVARLDALEKKVNDIIGGNIKCQKFKKKRS